MSEYLSKEEVKQWRSSLEKITLEEYAARLGKRIEETKPTKDLVDIVLQGKPVASKDWAQSRAEHLGTIAQRAMEREKEISISAFSARKPLEKTSDNIKQEFKPAMKTDPEKEISLRDEVRIVFNKVLTDREQKVFDHLLKNKNRIVYAKDLAVLLSLPRDYVYKYIKNLRAKIEGGNLENADKGGFMLSIN